MFSAHGCLYLTQYDKIVQKCSETELVWVYSDILFCLKTNNCYMDLTSNLFCISNYFKVIDNLSIASIPLPFMLTNMVYFNLHIYFKSICDIFCVPLCPMAKVKDF